MFAARLLIAAIAVLCALALAGAAQASDGTWSLERRSGGIAWVDPVVYDALEEWCVALGLM